ncbi:hypothetical protein Ancab_005764 [Ancistrocladus abbreviatus]
MAAIIDACFSKLLLRGDPNPASMDLSHFQEQPSTDPAPAPATALTLVPAPATVPAPALVPVPVPAPAPDAAPTTPTATPTKFKQRKRTTSPGVRILRGRIYDPENGKSCHQCRQKTMDFAAECTNLKQENKLCPMKFCYKCLLNRYGEMAEEVAALGNWICPKCRGICNCSFCMKKKGYKPTGILAHKAKATGFSSVSQLLQLQGSVNESKDIIAVLPCKHEEEHILDGSFVTNIHPKLLHLSLGDVKPRKTKREGLMGDAEKQDANPKESGIRQEVVEEEVNIHSDNAALRVEIQLPQGTEITTVGEIDMSPKDVGNALQFLEFCTTFGEILGLEKGQPESVLQEIMCGSGGRNGTFSSVVQFNIQLLALLQKDLGEESPSLSPYDGEKSWLHALKTCVSESNCELKDIPVECIDGGVDAYEMLDSSQKLKLLTFLCDETLDTLEMRNWIDDQILKFAEQQKEAKGRLVAAKDKEKVMKQKLQDEIAKVILAKNAAPLTISEHESIVSEIKIEAERAHAEIVEARGLVPKRKQRSDALRTQPIVLDAKGHVYWRLKAYNNPDLVLQDLGCEDLVACNEKWFRFDAEEKTVIEKYISTLRVKRRRRRIVADAHKVESINFDKLGQSSNGDDLPPLAIKSEAGSGV